MKRLFLKRISFVLALVMLLSLTGVAEDGGIDIATEANDADEMVLSSIEVLPEEADGMDLSVDAPLTVEEGVLSTEAPTSEGSGDDDGARENALPKKITLGVKETYTCTLWCPGWYSFPRLFFLLSCRF